MDANTSRVLVCWGTRTLSAALASGATLLTSVLAAVGGGPHHDTPIGHALLRLPQRAIGDFDGDGRPDLAVIRDGDDGPCILLTLSGSAEATCFDAHVASLVQHDIDHDGDLDLVAATPSGDLRIWINDGHGHFARMATSLGPDLSGKQDLSAGRSHEPATLGLRPSAPLPPTRRETVVIQVRIRPPTAPRIFYFALSLLPAFRGPPPFAN